MILKILKKDIRRNKVTAAVLLVFILLAALLVGSAANIVTTLFGAIDNMFAAGNPPHFVQMHSGEIDKDEVREFAETNPLVKDWMISEAVVADSSVLYWNGGSESDAASVMENYFVEQNAGFDYLLNLKSERIEVSRGEIAVPIYYLERHNLAIGDSLTIKNDRGELSLVISDFVRDAQMNPDIISSKRLVVSKEDFAELRAFAGEPEYSIEFLLTDAGRLSGFATAYQNAGLPNTGPAIDITLLRLMNALTDGITAAVVFLVSLLLLGIAFLCLRFAILGTLQEDSREIGVMKAIGIRQKDIRKIYLPKYVALVAAGCIVGCALSFPASRIFTANITLYIGAYEKSILTSVLPILAAGLLFLITVSFCALIFRKLRRVSAVEALRDGQTSGAGSGSKRLPISKSRLPLNLHLGLKDICGRPGTYLVLLLVFIIGSFSIIVPVNLLTTLDSPNFISYMGAAKSDIRLDMQQSENVSERFEQVKTELENDAAVKRFSAFVTCRYSVIGSDGKNEGIYVETGDYSVFPLTYSTGHAPKDSDDIALSALNAESLEKGLGDTLTLIIGDKHITMTVCGIYQDVTNGGKTAKAILPYKPENALWYTINADVNAGVEIHEKTAEYAAQFEGVKVSDITEYMSQTFGSTTRQIERIVLLAFLLSLSIAVLVSAMFLKMLMARDASGIRIMRSLGFTAGNIKAQYVTRMLAVLLLGIAVGTFGANTLGQSLAGMLMSGMGLSEMRFIISPLVAFVACPLALMIATTLTTFMATGSVRSQSLAKPITQ